MNTDIKKLHVMEPLECRWMLSAVAAGTLTGLTGNVLYQHISGSVQTVIQISAGNSVDRPSSGPVLQGPSSLASVQVSDQDSGNQIASAQSTGTISQHLSTDTKGRVTDNEQIAMVDLLTGDSFTLQIKLTWTPVNQPKITFQQNVDWGSELGESESLQVEQPATVAGTLSSSAQSLNKFLKVSAADVQKVSIFSLHNVGVSGRALTAKEKLTPPKTPTPGKNDVVSSSKSVTLSATESFATKKDPVYPDPQATLSLQQSGRSMTDLDPATGTLDFGNGPHEGSLEIDSGIASNIPQKTGTCRTTVSGPDEDGNPATAVISVKLTGTGTPMVQHQVEQIFAPDSYSETIYDAKTYEDVIITGSVKLDRLNLNVPLHDGWIFGSQIQTRTITFAPTAATANTTAPSVAALDQQTKKVENIAQAILG